MFRRAAAAIGEAEAIIITAGAGMGVDSGLPDFRGDQGFWRAYPPYARLGLSFEEAANPEHFHRDPAFGWGFYGHRTTLYRATVPHEGFALMRGWIERNRAASFVVTSNVDGQFQKGGYPEERILEVHGSIHWLQCTIPCSRRIWANTGEIPVNPETMRARAIPRCIACNAVSRPNILMFGDDAWLSERTAEQERRFDRFREESRGRRTVVIELGAGRALPTIRRLSERLGALPGTTVIRINPREAEIDAPHLSIPCGALEALRRIGACL
ncbi:NAD-dependent deacetylase [Geobacter sp. FeAm09]|uniref:SIR2 family NAD-dependent protein deacylase n=1 Tax=Geobacter sp. FeAm09 TaxID=2597769 RepID=UPI0011EC7BDD|nr:Sir2 family NAD-dependent protein deacetylase [Geobacter sp. FeAm09]QEM67434.1 NAD-dependent deacetylase [Geobacter sp. FeAm09]